MQVRDGVFLVTGAASGLGAATSAEIISAGGKVLMADLNAAALAERAAALGPNALYAAVDVLNSDALSALISQGLATFGAIHGAVHCAGILSAARVLGKNGPHDLEQFAKIIQVNLIGTFNVARLAAQAMDKNTPNAEGERGVLVLTASVAAYDGQIGQAAYAASKGGVASMTLPLARDLARHGIRVVSIAPGVFETAMMAAMDDTARAALTANVPFPHRLGKPQEFAQLACHIISNPMLNGAVLRLDGALRMPPK